MHIVSLTLIGCYLCQPIVFNFTSAFGYSFKMAEQLLVVSIEMPARSKSFVWQYFGFPVHEKDGVRQTDKSKTICKLCSIKLNYNGNTTNMATHIRRHHPAVSSGSPAVSEPATGRLTPPTHRSAGSVTRGDALPMLPTLPGAIPATATGPKGTASGQLRLFEAFKSKYPFSSQRAQQITRQVGIFIATDMRPLSIVDNLAFRQVLYAMDPRYDLPCRRYFSDKVIPGLYEKAKEDLVTKLKRASNIAITTDSWTSRATESYVTITVHFLSEDWTINNYVLQTRPLYESHTGVNVGEVLKDCMKEWGIEEKVQAIVTDNAANMGIAAKEAGIGLHVGCFARTVNLATQKGLKVKQMSHVLDRVRKIVGYFHRSTTAKAVFDDKKKLLQLPDHRLIMDVSTRWNSSYDMLQRFLELLPAILAACMSSEVRKNFKDIVTINENDITAIEDSVALLSCLKEITKCVCEEKNPTISLVHPMQSKIISDMAVADGDSDVVKKIKQEISKDISQRYTGDTIHDIHLLTAALDPRFSSLPYITECQREDVYSAILTEAITVNQPQVSR